MQVVKATRALEGINNGCTKPYYITCDDGEIYVVKFKQNPEGARALVNEFVCGKIAEILELPLAVPVLVEVANEFIYDYGTAIEQHINCATGPGLHFGTKKIKKGVPITNSDVLKRAKNVNVIPEIIIFDQLICNKDRDRNGGNLLFDMSKMEIVVIDHTHAFDIGPIWTEVDLKQRLGEPFIAFDNSGYVYRKLVPFVTGYNPFQTAIVRVKSLLGATIGNIINEIPNEWQVSDVEKAALYEYIMDRVHRIEEALPVLKPVFPYWKGGV